MAKNPQLSLGNLKQWLDDGRFDAAEQLARRLLAETPFEPNAHHALGLIQMQRGDYVGALSHLEQASAQLPNMPDVWLNLGSAYRLGKQFDAARSAYERALALEPRYLAALLNAAAVALEREDYYEAAQYASRALNVDPGNQAAVQHVARALSCIGRYDDAVAMLTSVWPRAGQHKKGVARDIVTMMLRLDRTDEAEDFVKSCERDAHGHGEYRALHAFVLSMQGKHQEALALYREAFASKKMQPTPEARFTFAAELLSDGYLAEGWRMHRQRHQMAELRNDELRVALTKLDGGNFAGKRVLLWSEQGIADELWYASLLPEVLATVGDAAIAVSPRLRTLFQRSYPGVPIIEKIPGKPANLASPELAGHKFDWHAPYADAAEQLRPDLASFAAQPSAFLKPDPALQQQWGDAIAKIAGGKPVIGISWRSTRKKKDAVGFTYPHLKQAAELMRLVDACWINLQYDDPDGKEAKSLEAMAGVALHTLEGLDLKDDLEGQAAALSKMQSVVGPANAPTVLAATVGTPTVSLWTQSLRVYWRTHGNADSTPWFPHMRLAVRRLQESWSPVMVRAADMLRQQLDLSATR